MKSLIPCLIILTAPLHAENLFDNGNMETSGGWKGTKKLIKEVEDGKENRRLVLSAKKKDTVSFNQEVDSKKLLSITLKFRYRTSAYIGRGLEVRGKRAGGGFTFSNYKLVADGKWHDLKWDFLQVGGSKEIDFFFILLEGDGDVFFDDISAEPLE